jgi:hypothetical protein
MSFDGASFAPPFAGGDWMSPGGCAEGGIIMANDPQPQKQQQVREQSVTMPRPEARQNPCDLDIQEGSERMQGEPQGRQNPRDKKS